MKSEVVDWDLYFEKITDVYDKWNKPSVYEKDENGNFVINLMELQC